MIIFEWELDELVENYVARDWDNHRDMVIRSSDRDTEPLSEWRYNNG